MELPTEQLDSELAHVLFIDIVGYSLLSNERQLEVANSLRDLVRQTAEFGRASKGGELVSCDTGDGMALVFGRNPLSPLSCAAQLAKLLQQRTDVNIRMGIHTGPVIRTEDINSKATFTGSGINIAQRVMDCGDAGHILVSAATAEIIRDFESFNGSLHRLGDFEVKHGKTIEVWAYADDVIGRKDVPSRQRAHSEKKSAKVVILYKRNSQHDEYALRLLESFLMQKGIDVFVDRHLGIGVEWAKEIVNNIYSADFVIVLLSEASTASEMLEYEVSAAVESYDRSRTPRLLPVRLNYDGPLTKSMAAKLDRLHQFVWTGSDQDDEMCASLLLAITNPQPIAGIDTESKIEQTGGAVPLDSAYYVIRRTDDQFAAAIARSESIVLVKGARQMGKTSLLARGLDQARRGGSRVVLTDFQTLTANELEDPNQFFSTLAWLIAEQLELDVDPAASWDVPLGPGIKLERFIRREVLKRISEPIVWGMDEVDRLFAVPFGSEVFGLFRSWHNRRALEPEGPWNRFSLAIAYATEAHLFIQDLNQSPFNVGTRLELQDFSAENVMDLNARYGQPLKDQIEIDGLMKLVGGQPYLVRRVLNEIVRENCGLREIAESASRDEGLLGDHLRRILVSLSQDQALTDVVKTMLKGNPCPDIESFARLRSAGIVTGNSFESASMRCGIYEDYLRRHLS